MAKINSNHFPGLVKFAVACLSILSFSPAYTQKSACDLLQPTELESALGGKAGGFTDHAMGTSHVCNGTVGKFRVTIRFADRSDKSGTKEQQGADMLRKQGWQISVKKDGDLTCSTAIPPASMSQAGYNTTGSIFRNGKVVAVEVVAATKEEMASIDVVRTLVEKAQSRM